MYMAAWIWSATLEEEERDALAEESIGDLEKHSNHMGSVASLGAKSSSEAFRGGLVRHEVAVGPPCTPPGSRLHEPAPAARVLSIKQVFLAPFRTGNPKRWPSSCRQKMPLAMPPL